MFVIKCNTCRSLGWESRFTVAFFLGFISFLPSSGLVSYDKCQENTLLAASSFYHVLQKVWKDRDSSASASSFKASSSFFSSCTKNSAGKQGVFTVWCILTDVSRLAVDGV